MMPRPLNAPLVCGKCGSADAKKRNDVPWPGTVEGKVPCVNDAFHGKRPSTVFSAPKRVSKQKQRREWMECQRRDAYCMVIWTLSEVLSNLGVFGDPAFMPVPRVRDAKKNAERVAAELKRWLDNHD